MKISPSLILSLVAAGAAGIPNIAAASSSSDDGDVIVIESFDNPRHTWQEMNDPVMGGESTGTFTVEDGVGKFQGEVVDVPFLQAPGFIQSRTTQGDFSDISSCQAIQLVLKSNVEDYQGYRFSFGNARAPGGKFFARGYKATLKNVPTGNDFGKVTIPLEDFTDFWDDATGEPIHTCQENVLYCPDVMTLQNMERLAIWGEGVAGKVDLEIQTIQAVGCRANSS